MFQRFDLDGDGFSALEGDVTTPIDVSFRAH